MDRKKAPQSLLLASAFAVALLGSQAKAVNLVTNPGFENPATPAGGFTDFTTGQNIGGWTVVGPDVALINTTFTDSSGIVFSAHGGLNSLDLTGIGSGTTADGVFQLVAPTVVGTNYTLSFWVGRATAQPPNANYSGNSTVTVTVDGLAAQNFTNSGSLVNNVFWQQFSLAFTANATSTPLTFNNGTANSNTNYSAWTTSSLMSPPLPPSPSPAR